METPERAGMRSGARLKKMKELLNHLDTLMWFGLIQQRHPSRSYLLERFQSHPLSHLIWTLESGGRCGILDDLSPLMHQNQNRLPNSMDSRIFCPTMECLTLKFLEQPRHIGIHIRNQHTLKENSNSRTRRCLYVRVISPYRKPF
jgi:hypothetical protein